MTMQISEHRNYGFFTNDDVSARQSYNDPFIYNDFQIMNIIPKEKDIAIEYYYQLMLIVITCSFLLILIASGFRYHQGKLQQVEKCSSGKKILWLNKMITNLLVLSSTLASKWKFKQLKLPQMCVDQEVFKARKIKMSNFSLKENYSNIYHLSFSMGLSFEIQLLMTCPIF